MQRRYRLANLRRTQYQLAKPAVRPRSITAPAPAIGEVRRTALPDTFDGIRFEVGRMAQYVQEARSDKVVIDCARMVAAQWGRMVEDLSAREGNPISAHNSKVIALEGIDLWCRAHFGFQEDGANVEVIQTPSRMIRTIGLGREVLERFMEPFYQALERSDGSFDRKAHRPVQVVAGDCDEASTLVCAMAAAINITPVAFRFGGTGGTLHHVWARAFADGEWYDSDVTEPEFKLGDVSAFEHYEEYEIPL